MRYEILGPVRIVNGDGYSFINARKAELVLVSLLGNADHTVTTEQLKAEIWRDDPPRQATAGIHSYIYQLRKTLGRLAGPSSRILNRPQGYILQTGGDDVDASLFVRHAEAGRAHARNRDHERAAVSFEKALAYWRGPVSWGGNPGPVIRPYLTYLTETRLESTELLVDAKLELGLHRELVGRLYTLTGEYPLREAFCRQLMLALYRSGQRDEALAAYQSARRTLCDDYGLDPCRSVQQLEQRIRTTGLWLDSRQPCPA